MRFSCDDSRLRPLEYSFSLGIGLISLDDDILKLIDEVELESFLKEASEALDDANKLAEFIREKAATAIERFVVSRGTSQSEPELNALLWQSSSLT